MSQHYVQEIRQEHEIGHGSHSGQPKVLNLCGVKRHNETPNLPNQRNSKKMFAPTFSLLNQRTTTTTTTNTHNRLFVVGAMTLLLLVFFSRCMEASTQQYRRSSESKTYVADPTSDIYVRMAPTDYEKWMAMQPSMDKVYKLSRRSNRRRESSIRKNSFYKTEYLFVLSDHNESPMFFVDRDDDHEIITIPNGMNISVVFDTLDEALDYVNNNETDPESVRFVIVMEHGEHKVEGREARIARPYTSITSTMPKYPEKTIIRANDISGQVCFCAMMVLLNEILCVIGIFAYEKNYIRVSHESNSCCFWTQLMTLIFVESHLLVEDWLQLTLLILMCQELVEVVCFTEVYSHH